MRNKSECARVGHPLDTIAETEPARPPHALPRCCAIAGERGSRRYLAAAVLRSADAQASATARLGSACPGNVAHPVFITNSVCS